MSNTSDSHLNCVGGNTQGVETSSSNSSDTINNLSNSKTVGALEKHAIAKVESSVEKSWIKCMLAEEKTKLLRSMVIEGIGTNDVEGYVETQTKKKFGKGKNTRDEKIGHI